MTVKIEKATVSDAKEILSLQRLAYRSEAEIYNDFSIEPLVQTIEQLQQQFEDHTVLKAILGDSIIGSVRANEQDGTCYIGKLMVHPNHQNKDIGKKLMSAIENLFSTCRYELFVFVNRNVDHLANQIVDHPGQKARWPFCHFSQRFRVSSFV